MDLGLQNKVAWVVGGSEGIGYAAAQSMLQEGTKVIISSRKQEKIDRALTDLQKETGSTAVGIAADATSENDMERAYHQIVKEVGTIDILIYAAGISRKGKLMELDTKDWKDNWDLNIVSFIQAIKLVVPEMKKKRGGRIIVTGASSGKQPTPNQLISNTTKGSLMPLVKTISNELAEDGILVNNVCPGRFLTPRRVTLANEAVEEKGISIEEYLQEVAKTVPLKRLGQPEEIGDLITFLASNKGSYITGQSINVDGGVIKSIL